MGIINCLVVVFQDLATLILKLCLTIYFHFFYHQLILEWNLLSVPCMMKGNQSKSSLV
uniref:Uncharacterized protein n=1 Tax=Rhizophora mucronata TaxID=61149 RepID=A0A2P2R136_RHIMU